MPLSEIKSTSKISVDLPLSIDLHVSYKPIYDGVCQLHVAGCYLIPAGGGDDGKKSIFPLWENARSGKPPE